MHTGSFFMAASLILVSIVCSMLGILFSSLLLTFWDTSWLIPRGGMETDMLTLLYAMLMLATVKDSRQNSVSVV